MMSKLSLSLLLVLCVSVALGAAAPKPPTYSSATAKATVTPASFTGQWYATKSWSNNFIQNFIIGMIKCV